MRSFLMEKVMFMRTVTMIGLVFICCTTWGCGEPEDHEAFTVSAPGIDDRDGYILRTQANLEDSAVGTDEGIFVGTVESDGGRGVSRGFLSFDISEVPARARIASAVLTVSQEHPPAGMEPPGTPYDALGPLEVDHVALGAVLDARDFDRPALEDLVGPLSSDGAIGPKTLEVARQVQADVASGRKTSDFRLRFVPGYPHVPTFGHYTAFNDSGDALGSGVTPSLLIYVEVPR